MSQDRVQYITSAALDGSQGESLYSKLLSTVKSLKQPSGQPSQWIGILKGLTQKGIKLSEIEDCEILDYLQLLDPKQKVTREEVVQEILRRVPRIKRVDLGRPRYSSYRNMNQGQYTERLYILSSEAMAADDRIDQLMFDIEDLGFDPSPLLKDPGLVDRLERELAGLKYIRPKLWDFKNHHFSALSEKHGKNVMAHARTTQVEDLFFIDEIQSDWAQKGRRSNWGPGYPSAPFVTNTEQWAGLVARDLMHEAALSGCRRVAWINWDMRNGWESGQNGTVQDDTFYRNIIPKIVSRAIEKAGGSVIPVEVQTKHGPKQVLGFEMTPSVREALLQAQSLYSREQLLPPHAQLEDPQRTAERNWVIAECRTMLGQAHTIRFVGKLYDIATGNEVAGRYVNRGIEISLRAKSMTRAARHEAWHFAAENLLLPHENREIRLSFYDGSLLNRKTRRALLQNGEFEAATQCSDPQECAAHAYALWCEGRLDMSQHPEAGIFERITKAIDRVSNWLEERVFGVKVSTPEDLFGALRAVDLCARSLMQAQESRQTADPHNEANHDESKSQPPAMV